MSEDQGQRYSPVVVTDDGLLIAAPWSATTTTWTSEFETLNAQWRRWVRALDRTERRSTAHAVVLALLAAYRRLHERLRGVTAITLARRPVPRAEAPPGREHGADTRRANGPPSVRAGPSLVLPCAAERAPPTNAEAVA